MKDNEIKDLLGESLKMTSPDFTQKVMSAVHTGPVGATQVKPSVAWAGIGTLLVLILFLIFAAPEFSFESIQLGVPSFFLQIGACMLILYLAYQVYTLYDLGRKALGGNV